MFDIFFLLLFIIIMIFIMFLMIRNHLILKLGTRNILRRKGYSFIVILGLMVGTGVISSSLVIGDTMNNMIESEVIDTLYAIDEIIVGIKPNGENEYFNESIFNEIKNKLSLKYIDGLSPSIRDNVAILNQETNLSEPIITLFGIDFENTRNFGEFINQDGEIVSKLVNNEIMIGINSAEILDAKVGHKIMLFTKNIPQFFIVTHILKSEGRASNGEGIFVNLNTAQNILDKQEKINEILISNKGGIYEGMDYTDEVKEEFENIEISDTLDFELTWIKKDILENNRESIQQFTNIFIVFGTFSIIAGVILIINIFIMLAEERKSEMGISRAVGMKRDHLKKMFIFEGTLYALFSSMVGVVFGIGVGFIIIFVIEDIFRSFGSISILNYFTFSISSVIIGFVSGFLITIFTIYLTSHRISRLNIVRAIRDIPEPHITRTDMRMIRIGVLFFIIGFSLLFLGVYIKHYSPFLSGISFLIFGSGFIIRRWIDDRIIFSLVGLFILMIWIIPSDYYPDYHGGIELFILSGLFMIFASLLIIMFNSDQIIKGIIFLIGKGKSRQAVLKTAISYSLKSKFRTGMIIAIFALIIFTITTMSMIVGILGTNIERQVDNASGGYDIIAFCNENSPIEDIEMELSEIGLRNRIEKISSPYYGSVVINNPSVSKREIYYTIIGVDDDFISDNMFEFERLHEEYGNPIDAWNAIKVNKNLVIIDASVLGNEYGPPSVISNIDVGDIIELKDRNNNVVYKTVIGILDTIIIRGIFSYEEYVSLDFNINTSNYFLFSIKDKENIDEVAKDIERNFLKNGMQTIAVQTLIFDIIKTMNQFFNLFEAYMGLGLIIGISGLGIITIRSVHERRQEIGMMRAIGFKKNMILSSFLIETSTIAIIGMTIGTILGIFTGYIIWRDEFQLMDFEFFINWQPIIIILLITFILILICIYPASRKASKIPPAEALRYKG